MAGVKRNLTVQLDEDVVRHAKVLAARRATSVSRLISDEITRLVTEDNRYQRAREAATRQLAKGFHLGGGPLPRRDSLHER